MNLRTIPPHVCRKGEWFGLSLQMNNLCIAPLSVPRNLIIQQSRDKRAYFQLTMEESLHIAHVKEALRANFPSDIALHIMSFYQASYALPVRQF